MQREGDCDGDTLAGEGDAESEIDVEKEALGVIDRIADTEKAAGESAALLTLVGETVGVWDDVILALEETGAGATDVDIDEDTCEDNDTLPRGLRVNDGVRVGLRLATVDGETSLDGDSDIVDEYVLNDVADPMA